MRPVVMDLIGQSTVAEAGRFFSRRCTVLVLSRKPNEGIVINGNVEVVVIDMGAGRVRLGITAPREIPVDRKEVHNAKRRAMEQGTNGAGEAA